MDRKETTEFLGRKLIGTRLCGMGKHFASEVTFDYGTNNPKRVDFVQFTPKNGVHVDGIEKGEFTCYEVKSCKEDLYSGHGINFFGEQNYLVMSMQTYKDVLDDLRSGKVKRFIRENFPASTDYFGVIVTVPAHRTAAEEFESPTALDADCSWNTEVILPCRRGPRKRSITEMLFCMLRSGR